MSRQGWPAICEINGMQDLQIRAVLETDLAQVLEIHNEVVLNTTAIYVSAPSTLEERRAWWLARINAGFPVLLALSRGQVAGFSTFGEFRGAWPGYLHSVEHSVHIRADFRGQGVGRALVTALFPLAARAGKHVMIGAIDASNVASLALHESLGFTRVAHVKEVGRKFERWLDLVFVQKFVGTLAPLAYPQ